MAALNQNDFRNTLLGQLLQGEEGNVTKEIPLSDNEYRSLRQFCSDNRISPLLINAVSSGLFSVSAGVAEECVSDALGVIAVAVRLESIAVKALATLDRAGIEARVTKGVATSHLDYPDPALRQFGDVDILTPPEQFPEALIALEEEGICAKFPLRGGRWQLQHSIPLAVGEFEIDLHHRMLHQAAGHLAANLDLFGSYQEFELGGRVVKALPPPLRLIQAAAQNVLCDSADAMISSDLDVLLLSGAVEEARDLASQADLSWVLELGTARAQTIAGLPALEPRVAKGKLEAVLARAYSSPHRPATRMAILEALVAPPLLSAQSFWSVLAPGSDYLALRGRSRRQQLRRQLDRLLPSRGQRHS